MLYRLYFEHEKVKGAFTFLHEFKVGYNAFNPLPILTVRGVKDPLTTGEYGTGFLNITVGIRVLKLKLVEDIHRVEVLSMLHLRNAIS